jgi:hypothetical protein
VQSLDNANFCGLTGNFRELDSYLRRFRQPETVPFAGKVRIAGHSRNIRENRRPTGLAWLGRECCSHLSLSQFPANREFYRELIRFDRSDRLVGQFLGQLNREFVFESRELLGRSEMRKSSSRSKADINIFKPRTRLAPSRALVARATALFVGKEHQFLLTCRRDFCSVSGCPF